MTTVTLIGEGQATLGHEFVFTGEASGCAGCPYRKQCLNLDVGTAYRITDVRDGAQVLPCAVHEDDVVAVEVKPTTATVNVPDRHAFSGNKTALAGPCPHLECPSHPYCVPDGLTFETDYQIVAVHGEPPHDTCALDRTLTHVDVATE